MPTDGEGHTADLAAIAAKEEAEVQKHLDEQHAELAKAMGGIYKDLFFAGPFNAHHHFAEVYDGTKALSSDEIITLGHRIQALGRAQRAMKELWEHAMMVHLRTLPERELSDGQTRWYIGVEKKVKPRDFRAMVGVVLDAAEGDLDRLVDVLSTSSFKPGACRELLGQERFDQAFETVVEPDLKTGKPKKTLQAQSLFVAAKAKAKKGGEQ